jgi:peroxiredoxin
MSASRTQYIQSIGKTIMEPQTITSSGKRTLVKGIVVLALLAIAAAGYFSFSAKEAAPEVTFTSLDGEKITSQSLRGKVVMVNFWATSCVTCIKEMPQMVETYNKYKASGLELVAVAMSYDPPNYVLNYAQTRSLPFKVALDTQGELAKSFGDVKLTPTTFVIDKNGNIIKRYVGEPEPKALHQLLEKELAV